MLLSCSGEKHSQVLDLAEGAWTGWNSRRGAFAALRSQRQEAVNVNLLRHLGVGGRTAVETVPLQMHYQNPENTENDVMSQLVIFFFYYSYFAYHETARNMLHFLWQEGQQDCQLGFIILLSLGPNPLVVFGL